MLVWVFARCVDDGVVLDQTLRNWVKAGESGKLNAKAGKPVTPEQMERSRLRVVR
ncbi:MAG: hypothetical protein L0H54_11115 [Alcaligenaceae bacterium]|nr:hypothetical protein [Alcaligenaceae bacterium]